VEDDEAKLLVKAIRSGQPESTANRRKLGFAGHGAYVRNRDGERGRERENWGRREGLVRIVLI
jgi:hypothetical protein